MIPTRFAWRLIATCVVTALLVPVTAAAESWTLESAIRHALARNPDARLAQHRIAAAQAGLSQANATFWPQVRLESSYMWTNTPAMVFGSVLNQRAFSPSLDFNDVPPADNLNIKGTLMVPLYAGGRRFAGRKAAQASAAAAQHQAEAVRSELAFAVARTYHTVLKTRAFVQATTAAVHSFEKNLEIARQRAAAGTLLKADVLDVAVRLAKAREDLVRAKNANVLARRTLRNLLGIEQGDITLADNSRSLEVPPTRDFSRRAELAAARQRVQAAKSAVSAAQAGYQPHLNAFGSLAYDYGSKFNGDGLNWAAGLMLRMDVWDGLATRARSQQARVDVESAREQQRKLRLTLDLEVEQARLRVEETAERLAVSAQSISQAEESVELTRARFEQGLALSTQLIDAETALTAARVRRAETEADQRIAVAALRKALGFSQLH